MSDFNTVILAAGKGTRMRSALPKVLHLVGGAPMVCHAASLAQSLASKNTVVVVPKQAESIQSVLQDRPYKKISYAVQAQQNGTGHALQCAMGALPKTGHVYVINGDMPLVRKESLQALKKLHLKTKSAVSFLSATVDKPFGLGRVVRDDQKNVQAIIEEKDATAAQKKINEINVGVYLFDLAFLHKEISKLKSNNKQKEYYLTDLVALAKSRDKTVSALCLQNSLEAKGVNTIDDLNDVNKAYYLQRCQNESERGNLIVGDQVFIDFDVKLGTGLKLESPCYLKGNSNLANGVCVESGVQIKNSQIGEDSVIKANCYLDQARLKARNQIGPFAHLRPGSDFADDVKVGNFVETKKTKLGHGSKVNHLSYVGDALVGKKVNVGAGTITCNYDGKNKFKTVLEDGVFIGSDTQLVAPVKVGKGAFVGAGSTITKNVAADSLALSRVPQKEIKGWAKKRK
ncbi:MAG: bifunctional UDP-N-acetylglucosamine diphosphorylase/glucosamine-1-phosphate N-acetyltransferase GlmU [Deltaproteobacteria bacterium]|nr:bifunctional UDP-N-acetylglucosamine diphosphorylase/glucosamine-1-phosphate N-acetyltransferase GlmU [Deltaproteobacteria bacterium]